MNRTSTALLAILLLTITSCGSGETVDGGIPIRVASVDIEDFKVQQAHYPEMEGPLRAIAWAPAGPAVPGRPAKSISVVFSRPMAALGSTESPPPGTVRFSPQVLGSLAWEGTRMLVFTPDEPLPDATEFLVSVGPLAALDGTEVSHEWTFESGRPRLAESWPSNGEQYWESGRPLRLRFDQPIEARGEGIFLEPADGPSVHVRVEQAGDSTLAVTPATELSRGSRYRLMVAEGLPSATGLLGTAEEISIGFRVLPEGGLLAVEQSRDWGQNPDDPFRPDRGVLLRFATPVVWDSVASHLTITPPVGGLDDASWYGTTEQVRIPGPFSPSTEYTVHIAEFADAFGQVVAAKTETFRTGILPPSLTMPAGVMYLEEDSPRKIPLRTTGISQVQASVVTVEPEQLFKLLRAYDANHWYGELAAGELEPSLLPANETLTFPVEAGQRLESALDLPQGTGVHLFRVDVPATPGFEGIRQFSGVAVVSPLAITAKFSPHESLALVTMVADASPAAGVTVEVWSQDARRLWSGQTEADGTVQFPGWHTLGQEPISEWNQPVLHLVAKTEASWTFTSSRMTDGIEPYRLNVPYQWYPEANPVAGTIFSDRGLYRAGDTVHLKGYLRTRASGDWRPISDSTRVLVTDPMGQLVLDRSLLPNELGSFDLSWTSPPGSTQGSYQVRVVSTADAEALTREAWQRGDLTGGSFRVDAFRTATFEVNASAAMDSYVTGDLFEGLVEARYLFGSPLQNAPVQVSLTQRSYGFRPPGFDRFQFGSPDSYTYRELANLDTTLSKDGTLRLQRHLMAPTVEEPTQLILEATAQSPDGQQQSGRLYRVIHPALHYIGIRTSAGFVDISDDDWVEADLVLVRPDGSAAEESEVEVELVRREWRSVRELGWDGRTRWRSETNDTVVGQDRVSPASGRAARIGFQIPRPGYYLIRARGEDIRGNQTHSEASLWAVGGGRVDWERADNDLIELVADRAAYEPGQTARILVPSPFDEATALVTVERNGVLSHEVQTITGGAPFVRVPLTDAHLPNVFVGVVLLSGRVSQPSAAGDIGAPAFRLGYANLKVATDERHLEVRMVPSNQEFKPGEEVSVALQVVDNRGRGVEAEVAFSAVDAGVLNLIGYRLPDPFDAFYGIQPLNVTTSETRAHLVRMRSFGQKEEDAGGGGGDSEFMLRKDFRAQAHWDPAVRTDASGRATVTFRLPESLTTFRLMAAAVADGNRFGGGTAQVVTTQPLVLQQAIPRFARVGDTWEAGVLVTNRTEASLDAVVAVEGSVSFQGSTQSTLRLEAGATALTSYPVQAEEAGMARLVFSATGASESDAFEIEIPLLENLTRVSAGMFASTDGLVTEQLAWRDGPTNRRSLDVRVSSTALVGLDGAVEYLFDYPYGCLEQRTSRVRPLVLSGDLVDEFGLEVLDGKREEIVADWLTDLGRYWTESGYSLWAGGRTSHPWVTAYVLNTMTAAQTAGYPVAPADVDRVASVLERAVRQSSTRPEYLSIGAWTDTQAFILRALSGAGRYLETETARVADALLADPAGSVEGMTQVLIVLSDQNRMADRRGALLDRIRSRIRPEASSAYAAAPLSSDYAWIFSSDTRASAAALTALSRAASDRETAELLVRGLLGRRDGGHWANTQDNASVVEALVAYRSAFEKDPTDLDVEVTMAGRSLLAASFDAPTLDVSSATSDGATMGTAQQFRVQASGTGRAYYSALLTQWVAPPTESVSQGLEVNRTMQRLDDTGDTVGAVFRAGDPNAVAVSGELYLVTLRLSSPTDRHYIVVDDPLPAGLEPVNTAFTSTRSDLSGATGSDRWWGSFNHTELRDERVLLFADYLARGEHVYRYVARAGVAGDFSWPGVQAEAMYEPGVRGLGAAGRLQVER